MLRTILNSASINPAFAVMSDAACVVGRVIGFFIVVAQEVLEGDPATAAEIARGVMPRAAKA